MYDINKLITPQVSEELITLLPTPKQKNRGRKRCQKECLFNGIIQVLRLGIPWKNIYDCGASASSCHRYFRELTRRGLFKKVFKLLAIGKTNIIECSADTDSTTSYRFSHGVGQDGRHKKPATKISLLTDINGLPADVQFDKGNKSDPSFLPSHLKNTIGRRKKILNLDKIYVSLDLRREMRRRGTFVNMETRRGDYIRKIGPKFKLKEDKYKIRFLIERTFSWIENFKRCKFRLDYTLSSFKSWIYLALIIILIRH